MHEGQDGSSEKLRVKRWVWLALLGLGAGGLVLGWPYLSEKFWGTEGVQQKAAEGDRQKENDEARRQAELAGDPLVKKKTITKTIIEHQTEVGDLENPQPEVVRDGGQPLTGAGMGITGGGRNGDRGDTEARSGEEDLSDQPSYIYGGRGPYAPGSGAGIAQPDYSTAGGGSGKSGKTRTSESASGKGKQTVGQKPGGGINSTGTTNNPFPGSAIARAVVKPASSVQGTSSSGTSVSVDGSGVTGTSPRAGLDKTTRYLAMLGLGGKLLDSVLAFFRSPGEGGDVVELYGNPPEPGKDLPDPVPIQEGQNPYKFNPERETQSKITVDKASFEACISRWSQIANPEGRQDQVTVTAVAARVATICTASLLSADPESGMLGVKK